LLVVVADVRCEGAGDRCALLCQIRQFWRRLVGFSGGHLCGWLVAVMNLVVVV